MCGFTLRRAGDSAIAVTGGAVSETVERCVQDSGTETAIVDMGIPHVAPAEFREDLCEETHRLLDAQTNFWLPS